jgi:hypothetical protein
MFDARSDRPDSTSDFPLRPIVGRKAMQWVENMGQIMGRVFEFFC